MIILFVHIFLYRIQCRLRGYEQIPFPFMLSFDPMELFGLLQKLTTFSKHHLYASK